MVLSGAGRKGVTVQKEGFLQELVSGIPQTPVLRSCSPLSNHCQRLHRLCSPQNCRDPLFSCLLRLLCGGQHRSDSGKQCEWEPGWGSMPTTREGSMRVRVSLGSFCAILKRRRNARTGLCKSTPTPRPPSSPTAGTAQPSGSPLC